MYNMMSLSRIVTNPSGLVCIRSGMLLLPFYTMLNLSNFRWLWVSHQIDSINLTMKIIFEKQLKSIFFCDFWFDWFLYCFDSFKTCTNWDLPWWWLRMINLNLRQWWSMYIAWITTMLLRTLWNEYMLWHQNGWVDSERG